MPLPVALETETGVPVDATHPLAVTLEGGLATLATSALQTSGNASLSSIDGKTPALVGGRVPVDGSGVTQPVSGSVAVSGTVTANAGTGTFAVSAASLPLPSNAAQESGGHLASLDSHLPAQGQALMAASLPVVIASNQSAVAVSASSLPLPSGAATETTLAAVKTAVEGTLTTNVSDRAARLLGVVYGSQGQQLQQSATNYNLYAELRTGSTVYDARQIRALTSSDQITTVPSGTQTISGTVTANAGTGTFTVGGVAAAAAAASGNPVLVAGSDGTNVRTLLMDSSSRQIVAGAGTAGSASGGVLTVQGVTSMTPLLSRISDGTNAAAIKAASTAAAATDSSLVVALSPNTPALTPTITNKSSSASSITLLSSNSARKGAGFYNLDVNDLYVNEAGGTATTSIGGFTVVIPYRGYWELPTGANGGVTTGTITGIWSAAGSSGVSITERA